MRLRNSFLLLLITPLFLSTSVLHGQTAQAQVAPVPLWVMVAGESSTVAVVLPAGTTYRFGNAADNLWSAPITVTEATTFSPVYYPADVFPFADPDPGVVKELDVLETTAPQAIQVTNLAASPATTVSQMVPALTPPTSVPVLPGTAYTVTFSNFLIPPTAPQNAQMVAFVNAPETHANQAWEGTQMNLTIDGVTMVCTLGPGNTAQTFSLNCTVPAASGN
jgi:hypothetical protein